VKLEITEDALLDLETAVSYIADRNPAAARRMGDHILDVVERLVAGASKAPSVSWRPGSASAAGRSRPFASTTSDEAIP
jgi:plasmid stabilization system protein ParE